MPSINFSFNSKNNNQEKINEYNKKALLQVQNMIARQKRIIKNQRKIIENKKNSALNEEPIQDILEQDMKVDSIDINEEPIQDILEQDMKVDSIDINEEPKQDDILKFGMEVIYF